MGLRRDVEGDGRALRKGELKLDKIPTIFERDWDNDPSRVLDQVMPGCEWVLAGEGVPLHKYDGTCVMYDGERWWARREVKEGKEAPEGFRPIAHDHKTLAAIGWEPIESSPFAKFHAEAIQGKTEFRDGTYELIGPKINKNPEGSYKHILIAHENAETLGLLDRSFEGIKEFLAGVDIEGIVFRRANGDLAKIKKRDFGLRR